MSNDSKLQHAQFDLPQPPDSTPPTHPFRNPRNHARLLEYIQDRLALDLPNRDQRVQRYAQIDRDVAGFIKLSDEDAKRRAKHIRDGTPQATEFNLPLTWVHLDDMMTYFAQTFAPNRGMFYHTAQPGDTEDSNQLITLMNNHALHSQYYRHFMRAIFDILKYDRGGVIMNWAKETGPKITQDVTGESVLTQETIFAGNKIRFVDMYNFFYDPGCEITELYKEGEWFGVAEAKNHYWLKKRCLDGIFFNCEEELNASQASLVAKYYKDPPAEARITNQDGTSGSVNWHSILSGLDSTMMNNVFELVTVYIKLNPNDFGLIGGNRQTRAQRNQYETWRVVLLNDTRIIQCEHMNNVHGNLPAYFGVVNDDIMREASKSPAEHLNPLQELASFIATTHVKKNRKNLVGTTYFDPSRVDMTAVPEGEVAARVPVKPAGYGKDIRTMVYREDSELDTKNTIDDLSAVMAVINEFFPAQSLPSQIAGIERAVESQVTAVQQGVNRRQQKAARLIDESMMLPLRFALYHNIVQYQQDTTEIIDYYTGKPQKFNLAKLRDTNLSYVIGLGLKAIDRQYIAMMLQKILFSLIQAPSVSEGIDILGLLDHWTNMMDIDTNMKQFAIQQQPPAAPEAISPGAEGNTIQPATNPTSLEAPIYGGA